MTNENSITNNSQKSKRLRVLISAYACEPGKGSEPGVGWNWSTRMSEHCDLWVITRANNREVIEKEPLSQNIHWIYVDGPGWMLRLKKGRAGVWAYYRVWQYLAYRKARKLIRTVRMDVVHHLTFGTYWAPTDMAKLGVPLVVGPVGGAELVRWACIFQKMSFKGMLYEIPRNISILSRLLSPGKHVFFRKVSVCVAKNKETARMLSRFGACVGGVYTEAAMSSDECEALKAISTARIQKRSDTFRMLCIGELRALKGGYYVLEALKRLSDQVDCKLECVFLGDGPEKKRLAKLAENMGLANSVKLTGRVPRTQVLEQLGRADVLLHPTLHDSGGWTCLEAMAAGVPVVSLNVGGPAQQVAVGCGVLITPLNPDQIIDEITKTLVGFIEQPELLDSMKKNCLDRVATSYLWDDVVAGFLKFYYQAVDA